MTELTTAPIEAPTSDIPSEQLITARDAARTMGVSKARVYTLVERRAIPHYRIGRLIRLRTSDIVAYLESQRVERVEQFPRYGCAGLRSLLLVRLSPPSPTGTHIGHSSAHLESPAIFPTSPHRPAYQFQPTSAPACPMPLSD